MLRLIIISILFFFYSLSLFSQDNPPITIELEENMAVPALPAGINLLHEYGKEGSIYKAKKDGKMGLFDREKNSFVIPNQYDDITFFRGKNEVAIARISSLDSIIGYTTDTRNINRYFLVDNNNNRISTAFDYYKSSDFEVYDVIVVRINDKYCLLNSYGKISSEYYDDINLKDDLCFVKSDNKYGILSLKDNRLVVPLEYSSMECVNSDRIAVKKDGKMGFINKNNKVIIPFIYDEVRCFVGDKCMVKIRGKASVIDINNKALIPFEYDEVVVLPDAENIYQVSLDGKYGLTDASNNRLTEIKYDKIISYNNGYRKVMENGKYGLINEKGKEIVPCRYGNLYTFDEKDRLRVFLDGKWGIINLKNELIIPFKYRKISKSDYKDTNEYSKSKYIYKVSLDGNKYFIIDEGDNIIYQN